MAIVTGWYPVAPYLSYDPYNSITIFTKKGPGYDTAQSVNLQGFGDAEPYLEHVRQSWANSAPWNVTVEGLPTPQLNDVVIPGRKVRISNTNYKARSKRGELVMSDYVNVSARLTFRNGGRTLTEGTPTFDTYGVERALRPFGWTNVAWYGPLSPYALDPTGNTGVALGGIFGMTPYGILRHKVAKSKTDDVTPLMAGFDKEVIRNYLDKNEVTEYCTDTDACKIVTATHAEANLRTVDVLTALAELPETVRYITTLCKQVFKIYTDARRKHFRLRNKASKVEAEHVDRIHRHDYETAELFRAAKTKRERDILMAKRNAMKAQIRKERILLLKEISDAVTSLWLEFRYAIMPNVYLVEDLLKAHSEDSRFFRFQKREIIEIEPPEMLGFKVEGKIQGTLRCCIKRRFNQESVSRAHYSWNFAVSLWELIPLSFVIDWFVNVGDFIASLTGSTRGYEQAATLSLRLEDTSVTYLHESSQAKVQVEFSGYLRNVIDPSGFSALIFDPDMNLQRYLDAASLSYQIFLKQILSNLQKRK